MDTTMVNISHNIPVFHVFVTFISKSTVIVGGFREIQDAYLIASKKPMDLSSVWPTLVSAVMRMIQN
jgi:hypothetical protein